MKNIIFKIWAFIAIQWLNKRCNPEKVELITTKSFILKAERKRVINTESGGTMIQRTFSIHRHVPPGTVSARAMWTYDKYVVGYDDKYEHLRSGKYPENWE